MINYRYLISNITDQKLTKREDIMGQVSDIKKVFISYSWDSTAHQQWVLELVYKLRDNGVDASIDILKTHETVNLNTMMVSNIRDNDYIIIVLTENYSKKLMNLLGGWL